MPWRIGAIVFLLVLGPVALGIGYHAVKRWINRKANKDWGQLPLVPETEERYKEKRSSSHEFYEESMKNYDKALVWASGGAFAVSYTAIHLFVRTPAHGTPIFLLAGWFLLVMAVILEVGNPYSATRTAVYEKATWKAQFEGNQEAAKQNWGLARAWGSTTKRLNEWTYYVIIIGFYYLSVFLIWNILYPVPTPES